MTITVTKEQIFQNIYKNFYDLVSTISGLTNVVFPEFPDVSLTSSSSYPICIIDSPKVPWKPFTFGKSVTDGTIDITIYTITPKDTDQYSSDISDKIETSKKLLADVGLQEVQLDDSDGDFAPQGEIKVHFKTLTFKYKFYFDKTRAY